MKHLLTAAGAALLAGFAVACAPTSTEAPAPPAVASAPPPAVAPSTSSLSSAAESRPVASPEELIGKPAPEWTLKSRDGKEVSLASLRGKPVMLDFWATWCPPCRKMLPSVQKLHAEKGGSVHVVGISDEDDATVKPFLKEQGLTMLQLAGNETVSKAYGIEGIPTTIFIDKDGVVREAHVGLSPGDPYQGLLGAVAKTAG